MAQLAVEIGSGHVKAAAGLAAPLLSGEDVPGAFPRGRLDQLQADCFILAQIGARGIFPEIIDELFHPHGQADGKVGVELGKRNRLGEDLVQNRRVLAVPARNARAGPVQRRACSMAVSPVGSVPTDQGISVSASSVRSR